MLCSVASEKENVPFTHAGVEGTGHVQRPLLDPAPCYSPYVEGSETSWGKVSGGRWGEVLREHDAPPQH